MSERDQVVRQRVATGSLRANATRSFGRGWRQAASHSHTQLSATLRNHPGLHIWLVRPKRVRSGAAQIAQKTPLPGTAQRAALMIEGDEEGETPIELSPSEHSATPVKATGSFGRG